MYVVDALETIISTSEVSVMSTMINALLDDVKSRLRLPWFDETEMKMIDINLFYLFVENLDILKILSRQNCEHHYDFIYLNFNSLSQWKSCPLHWKKRLSKFYTNKSPWYLLSAGGMIVTVRKYGYSGNRVLGILKVY